MLGVRWLVCTTVVVRGGRLGRGIDDDVSAAVVWNGG
jgi:hypothetical protein